MSTHATPETRDGSTAESTFGEPEPKIEADAESDSSVDEPAPMDPFDAHDAAATFGSSTERLPNTVDAENAYLGQ
ncbi:hypothetical protein HZS55_10580 [Halosimplex rubrum]|uniref:Uncharacterized protein n=1 Tax=Halosimplex rubrum TaxID=869889 RepID=A0A7D5P530_9EURY|nr:hypothetical protein [Halosimplex rubrum]QLH77718.1 hypothetical protein HZS55_10580 [Halosimplex rubrum]